jgi:hypothetical protein
MANVFFAAALLSSVLAVSGCMGGLLPDLGALGSALGGNPSQGGYPAYGGGQPYPYNPGAGGGYAQPVQPYYQPQPYAYSGSGNPEIYYQPTPQTSQGYTAPAPERWTDQRQLRRQARIQPGQSAGQLTPREARRLQREQRRIGGGPGQMGANGNLSPHEQARLNRSTPGRPQNLYRPGQNGIQAGPMTHSRPTRAQPPVAQVRPGGQPPAEVQPRGTAQPRTTTPRWQEQPQ